jgi:hypothetical protein
MKTEAQARRATHYVLECDGSVYSHLFKRRDWVHADLLESRY